MTSGPTHELAVDFDAGPTAERIGRYRRLVRGRLIGLVITIAILVAFTVWQRERAPLALLIIGNAIVVAVSLAVLVGTWLLYRRARGAVATLGEGVALRVDPGGLVVLGRRLGWSELGGLDTAKGPFALGPRLRVRDRSGAEQQLPWDQLAVRPATLDSTVRAYSGGRFGVDLSELDA